MNESYYSLALAWCGNNGVKFLELKWREENTSNFIPISNMQKKRYIVVNFFYCSVGPSGCNNAGELWSCQSVQNIQKVGSFRK